MYRDTTQISHEGTNLNERWPTIGVSTHDSSSHASSNCDVADDRCIENEGTNLNERWPTIGVSTHDSSSHASSNFDIMKKRIMRGGGEGGWQR